MVGVLCLVDTPGFSCISVSMTLPKMSCRNGVLGACVEHPNYTQGAREVDLGVLSLLLSSRSLVVSSGLMACVSNLAVS